MGSNTQDPYGSSTESPERAYLSRLQALAVNTGLRGKMNGTETVDQLFALLFEPPEGKEAAEGRSGPPNAIPTIAPWTAPGRSGEGRLYEGKGGVLAVRAGRKGTFRPYPPRGELGRLREHATATDPDKRDRLMEGLDVFLGA